MSFFSNVGDKLGDFKDWLFSPSVKSWLKAAFKVITSILGSPQAVELYITFVAASLGLTVPEVKILWDFIMKLIKAAESAHPEPGSGDTKYAEVKAAFQKQMGATFKTSTGEPVTEFQFDLILHVALAEMKVEKAKGIFKP